MQELTCVTNKLIQEIIAKLEESEVLKKQGVLTFDFAEIKIQLDNKDIIGGVLQSWFDAWLSKNGYSDLQIETQTFPDFLFKGEIFLELKTFNSEASPAFDIANFASYIDSLLVTPQRLNADYLIFSYKVKSKKISLSENWVKKIWEISGPSRQNIINLQVKRHQPYNIRPTSGFRTGVSGFASRRQFVDHLWRAGLKFETPESCDADWFRRVESKFKQITGTEL